MIDGNHHQQSAHRRPVAVLVGITGLLAAALCTADWMTNPDVARQLWPADIHSSVVGMLGGTTSTGVTGRPEYEITLTAVLIRCCTVAAFSLIVSRALNRSEGLGSVFETLLLRVGLLGYAAVLIWGVQLVSYNALSQGLLPPLLMMLAGIGVFSCLSALLPPFSERGRNRWSISLLILVTIGWIAVSFRLNERLYANLLIPHGDSAMYEEHLWNVWHGKGFRSYLDQGLFLGEHIQVIHLLLLPVHILWPSHLMLELAESIALGSCTIPLFLMVRRRTSNDVAACLLAISWLFFFPMHFLDIAIDQKTFRPMCLGLPFLLWMIHCAETGRYRSAWLCLLIALSAKEDMALITAPLTAVMAWLAYRNCENRKLRHWSLMASGTSAVWLVAAVLFVIPAFRSGDVVHYSRYFGDLGSSPGELVQTALMQPNLVLSQLFSVRTLMYVLVFLCPLAFIVVRRSIHLLAGSLTFGMLSLIQLGNGAQDGGLPPVPYHHFHGPLLPVIFWTAASTIETFQRRTKSRWGVLPQSPVSAALLILCCCLTTGVTGSLLPYGAGYWSNQSSFGRHALYFPRTDVPAEEHLLKRAAMADILLDQIPMQARVASTDFIHTRLTHRDRSYDYSGYRRVVNEEGKRVPSDCDQMTGSYYPIRQTDTSSSCAETDSDNSSGA